MLLIVWNEKSYWLKSMGNKVVLVRMLKKQNAYWYRFSYMYVHMCTHTYYIYIYIGLVRLHSLMTYKSYMSHGVQMSQVRELDTQGGKWLFSHLSLKMWGPAGLMVLFHSETYKLKTWESRCSLFESKIRKKSNVPAIRLSTKKNFT